MEQYENEKLFYSIKLNYNFGSSVSLYDTAVIRMKELYGHSFPLVKQTDICLCTEFRLTAAGLFKLCGEGGRERQIQQKKENKG